MPDLTVVGANLHNSKGAVRYLRRRSRRDAPDRFDIGGVCEAHRRRRMLRAFPGHDYRTGDTTGPAQETGILVARHLTDLGGGSEFLSPEAERFDHVGQERWGQDRIIELGGVPIAPIVYHPIAGPKALHGKDPNHPLVRRYARATRWLEAKVDYHTTLGREVVVISDCQMREGAEQLWSPRHVFENHGMRWLWERIDVIAWTSGLVLVGNPKTRVREGVLPDHPLLRVELNINRTKRR